MFYFQSSINSQCFPIDREKWEEIISRKDVETICHNVKVMEEQMREYVKGSEPYNRWHDAKAKAKKKLPLFVFMAGNIAPSKHRGVEGCWRKASAITLNGLVMADFDGMDDPLTFAKNLTEDFYQSHGILLVHVTPSHHGLRFVFKADTARGNIADNQAWLAKELSLPLDGVCKDSSRGSYAFHKSMLVYLNEAIFDYENPAFEEKYGNKAQAQAPLEAPLEAPPRGEKGTLCLTTFRHPPWGGRKGG